MALFLPFFSFSSAFLEFSRERADCQNSSPEKWTALIQTPPHIYLLCPKIPPQQLALFGKFVILDKA